MKNAPLNTSNANGVVSTDGSAEWHRSMARRWIGLAKRYPLANPRDDAANRAREHLRWAHSARRALPNTEMTNAEGRSP